MALITNTFTLTVTTAGAFTLTSNNSYMSDATTQAPLTNLVKLQRNQQGEDSLTQPIFDADNTELISIDDLKSSPTVFNDLAIVVSRETLEAIGKLATTIDIRANLNLALESQIDKIGGRDFLNKLIIEDLYKNDGAGSVSAFTTTLGGVALVNENASLSAGLIDVTTNDQNSGSYASLGKDAALGMLRLFTTLQSDPSIDNLSVWEVDPGLVGNHSVTSVWENVPKETVYRFGGKFDTRPIELSNFSALTLTNTTLTATAGEEFGSSPGIKIGQIFTVDNGGTEIYYRVTALGTGTGGTGTYTVAKLSSGNFTASTAAVTGFIPMPSDGGGGIYDYISAPSGFAAKVAPPTNGISNFPLDKATIDLLGQLEMPPPLAIDLQPLGTGKVGLNIELIKAISDNNLQFSVINSPTNKSLQQLFSISDTTANISALTPDSAKALQAISTNLYSVDGFFGGWEPWELKVTDAGATPVTLSYETAQTLSNIGWRIALTAKVNVNIEGEFGSITAEELSQLSWAGVDKVAFNSSIVVTDAAKVAKGQLIIDQNSSWGLAKLNMEGLSNNSNIDVAFSVDDTPPEEQYVAGFYLPTAIIRKTGVDRVIAQDGVLDISLFDSQKIISSKLKLGNDGDNSDVSVYVQNDWELSNLKSRTVASLADAGADIIVYANNNSQEIDYSYSSARSKNFLDSMAFAVSKGMSLDFSQYLDRSDLENVTTEFYNISLSVSALSLRGAGAAFVSVLNNIGTEIDLTKNSYSWQNGSSTLGVKAQASGIKTNWVSISDYSDMQNENGVAKASDLTTFTKLVARANSGGVTLSDIFSADTAEKSGLMDVLSDVFSNDESEIASYLNSLGRQSKGINNLYADFRMSDMSESVDGEMARVFLENASKAGFKGLLVDDTTINRYETLSAQSNGVFQSTTNGVDINNASSTLDCVYLLDATNYWSSVGLSKYLIDQSGYLFDEGEFMLKGSFDTGFQNRVNLVDKVLVTGAADGDFQIDLTGLGVDQDNFTQKITAVTGKIGQFNIAAENGKTVTLEIVGLIDNALFTKADIFDIA